MKILTGKVLANKNNKTITVEVVRVVIHRLYGKRFKRSKKYQVHDETGVQVGQTVRFVATKPISKLKKWMVIAETKEKKGKEQK